MALDESHQEPEPEDDSPFEEVRERLFVFRRFFHTKKAVRAGEAVHEMAPADRRAAGFLGPWSFGFAESWLAAFPGIVLGKLAGWFTTIGDERREEVAANYRKWVGLAEEKAQSAANAYVELSEVLEPLSIPLSLTVSALLLCRAALRSSDLTPERRKRSLRAYLYFNGAYGLLPQMIIVTLASGLAILHAASDWEMKALSLVLGLVAMVAWLWLIYIEVRTVPRLLFASNGYSATVPGLFGKKAADIGPWNRYTVVFFVIAPIVLSLVFSAVQLLVGGIGWVVGLLA
ncbi:MAG: hypothetical protein AAF533_26010 [Acidobacteriota bacterium]